VEKDRFDLIFLDLVMPGLDGSEVFKRIRKIDEHVPVAIITGHPDSELLAKAMEQGPFIVMKKPLDIYEIRKTVYSLTNSGNGGK
jgi:DNA-binding NtrC family response regulator